MNRLRYLTPMSLKGIYKNVNQKNERREGNYTDFWIENLGTGPNLSIITLNVIK